MTDWSFLGIPLMVLACCVGYSVVHYTNYKTGRWRRGDDA